DDGQLQPDADQLAAEGSLDGSVVAGRQEGGVLVQGVAGAGGELHADGGDQGFGRRAAVLGGGGGGGQGGGPGGVGGGAAAGGGGGDPAGGQGGEPAAQRGEADRLDGGQVGLAEGRVLEGEAQLLQALVEQGVEAGAVGVGVEGGEQAEGLVVDEQGLLRVEL